MTAKTARLPLIVPLWIAALAVCTAAQVGAPVEHDAYLKASNAEGGDPVFTLTGDRFGNVVAISGDTVVVGASAEDSNATGVDGDQDDNSASGSGAAYVFVRDGNGWTQQAYLKATNSEAFDLFGESVAISGDTIVVGAPWESSNATGVDGDQADNSAYHSGAAYVFERRGTVWIPTAYLKASNAEGGNPGSPSAGDEFGTCVAVSGNTVVVGATLEDSSSPGVNGDEADNSADRSGAAYVFVREGNSWSQQAYVKASNPDEDDEFGQSLSISGDTLVVGTTQEDSNAVGVDGDQTDNSAKNSGAAYVFTRKGTTWSQQAYLKASNTAGSKSNVDLGDFFGRAVAVSGDTIVIGANGEDSAAPGVDGDQTDNSALDSGAAYVFTRNGTSWCQQAYLKASNPQGGVFNPFEPFFLQDQDAFGDSVSISGDTVVVGTGREDSSATGVDGDQDDNSAGESGAAYVFVRDGEDWSQQAYVKASNTDQGDNFARSVAVSGNRMVAGAPDEDSAATVVDGDQADNSAPRAGAAYVIDIAGIVPSPWDDLGFALPGTYGPPTLVAAGPLTAATEFTVELSGALEDAHTYLFVGPTAQYAAPFYGGTLVPDVSPPGAILLLVTDGAGNAGLESTWPTAAPTGSELYLQFWISDPGAPFGYAASNAIRGTAP